MAFRAVRHFAAAATLAIGLAAPAQAQFFWKSVDLRTPPVRGDEAALGFAPLPNATAAELQAARVWNLRSGLNVAALQCQFAPELLTLNQYNHLLGHHDKELGAAFQTLTAYFKRTNKGAKAAQTALDRYGTRVYSGYSTIGGQFSFCQAASDIGRDALFAPRGQIHTVATARLGELRNSLKAWGEQQFRHMMPLWRPNLPSLADACWKGDALRRRCGGRA